MDEMRAEFSTDRPDDEQRLQLHSAMKNERSIKQLAKLEEEAKLLQEADSVVQDLEGIKGQYLEVLDTVSDREKSISLLEN